MHAEAFNVYLICVVALTFNLLFLASWTGVRRGQAKTFVNPEDAKALKERIEVELRTLHSAVAELKLDSAPNVKDLSSLLGETLKGWSAYSANCLVFEGGGVVLHYPDGGADAAADWEVLAGAAPELDSLPNGGRALRLFAGEEPTVLRFKLPLRKLVDVRMQVMLGAEAKAGSRFTILPIVEDAKAYRGEGLDWGAYPMRYVGSRTQLSANAGARDLKLLAALKPVEIKLVQRGNQTTGVLKAQEGKPVQAQIKVAESGGYLVLVLVKSEVWLTDFEVRGLFDPERATK